MPQTDGGALMKFWVGFRGPRWRGYIFFQVGGFLPPQILQYNYIGGLIFSDFFGGKFNAGGPYSFFFPWLGNFRYCVSYFLLPIPKLFYINWRLYRTFN